MKRFSCFLLIMSMALCGVIHAERVCFETILCGTTSSSEDIIIREYAQPELSCDKKNTCAPIGKATQLVPAQKINNSWFGRMFGSMPIPTPKPTSSLVHLPVSRAVQPCHDLLSMIRAPRVPTAVPAPCKGRDGYAFIERPLPPAGTPFITLTPPKLIPAPLNQSTALVPVHRTTLHWAPGIPTAAPVGMPEWFKAAILPAPDRSTTALVPYNPSASALVPYGQQSPKKLVQPQTPKRCIFSYPFSLDGTLPVVAIPRGMPRVPACMHVPAAAIARATVHRAIRAPEPVDTRVDDDWLRKIKILARQMRDAARLIGQRIDFDRGQQAAHVPSRQRACGWLLQQDVLSTTWDVIDPLLRGGALVGYCLEDELALRDPLQAKLSFKQKYDQICELNKQLQKVKAVPAGRERVARAQMLGTQIVHAVHESIIDGYYRFDRAGDMAHGYQRVNKVHSACNGLCSRLARLPLDG